MKQFELVFSELRVALPVCRTWRVPGSGPWRDQLSRASGESDGQRAPEGGDGEPDLRHPGGHHARQRHAGPNLLLAAPGALGPTGADTAPPVSGGWRASWSLDSLTSLCMVIPSMPGSGVGASVRRGAHGPEHVHEAVGSGCVEAGRVLSLLTHAGC